MANTDTSVTIKPLTAEDLEAVIAIDLTTSGVSRHGYFERGLSSATDRPKEYVYVGLHADGGLQGFAFAKLVSGEFGKPGASASLDAIGINPAHGHRGYGQQLLESVEKVLTKKGVTTLTSQIDWANGSMIGFFGGAGFDLAPRSVLTRSTAELLSQPNEDEIDDGIDELDYSSPDSDDFDALSRDKVPVRSMVEGDLSKIISIDEASTGIDRTEYYRRKQHESLHESGVRVSLVAELEGFPVGFIMARVDFGEFGHTSTEAVMDSIGVDAGYKGQGVGHALMSQLLANLAILRVDHVRTEIDWDDVDLIAYFSAAGFVPAQRITLQRDL
jgi:ribosomal protein S18 acetylase RimI-like enzyme